MLNTFLVVLISLILGFILYQVPFIGVLFNNTDTTAMFQISNMIMLIVVLYLMFERRSE